MTRLAYGMDPCELDRLAALAGVKLVYRNARCEHGYTRDQTCVSCENGYVQDTAIYANVGEIASGPHGEEGYSVSDDHYDVAYWPARYAAKFHKALRQVKTGGKS